MDLRQPLISLAIPAYKNPDFLNRLLTSISIQNYTDFEVIVTDDSPDESVKNLCQQYENSFAIYYYRNPQPLGTPENWNEAIRKAKGEWIKLMHDDDWFCAPDSLLKYVEAIYANRSAGFIFAAYRNIYLDKNTTKDILPPEYRLRELEKNPVTLMSRNIIGPPSAVIYKNDRPIYYDKQLKWLVDIDFYIRYLKNSRVFYINEVLVNIGVGDKQVTQDCFRQRPIEIPENFSLLNKAGWQNLKNTLVFDAWWRLMRNLRIRDIAEVRESGYNGPIPQNIRSMIRWQKNIPSFILNIGPVSKSLMFLKFLLRDRTGKR